MENIHPQLVDVVKDLLAEGWRVFIAKRGDYGFFTNEAGERTVSFDRGLGGLNWSGNYKTSDPRQTGDGWRLEPSTYMNMFAAYPPQWAVRKTSWKYQTLDMKLAVFQKTSQYEEIIESLLEMVP